ncbi:MAG: YfhO family protein [Psychroflexus sp.]|nr:YfhO family protein [Psychroflexus sp.]
MNLKKFSFKLLPVLGFILIALAFFYPVLQGKVIYQSDIAQYKGMSKQMTEYQKENDDYLYWTDRSFVGMPTYQLGAEFDYNYVKEFDRILRFLPRPADYLFLYFIGLYILLLVFKVDYRIAFIGALAFGFSTYLIVILQVGHNSKAHAIAYMPLVIAGIVSVFRKNYILGGLGLALAAALEVSTNHYQMTYYLLFLVVILGIIYLIDAIKQKTIPDYLKAVGVMLIAGIIALSTNSTRLLSTKEYTDFSTRGPSALSDTSKNENLSSSGLTYDYITSYSYGALESFNLLIPNFMGGSSSHAFDEESEIYDQFIKMGASPVQAKQYANQMPAYWGDQPYVAAPAYIGAVVIFLFMLALFLVKSKHKYWIVATSLLALLLSWGDNFSGLTRFFIDYIPLYDKFRAVSSIQVLIELCVPLMAFIGLSRFFSDKIEKASKIEALKRSAIITGGIMALLLVFGGSLFDFSGAADQRLIQQQGGEKFVTALIEDRKGLFYTDTFRSLIFIALIAGSLWLYLKEKIKKQTVFIITGLLIVIDLAAVDYRYISEDDFVREYEMRNPFVPNKADKMVMNQEGLFRVLDFTTSPFNSARASFFHHSVGGYHAAKPGRIQDLYDYHIGDGNQEVLNMLNVRYVLLQNQGKTMAQPNPDAYGNAWFVDSLKFVSTNKNVIKSLANADLKQTAIIHDKWQSHFDFQPIQPDSTATVKLVDYQPNQLTYAYSAQTEQVAVFSENYYPHGWKATINGQPVDHFRVNYTLRGLQVPKGKGEITFTFDPEVVKTGENISLAGSIVFVILLLAGGFYTYRKRIDS